MQNTSTQNTVLERPQRVREAGPEDFEIVMQLLEEAFTASRYAHLNLAKVRMSKVVKAALTCPPAQRIFLALKDGVPVGLIGGTVSPYLFADALTATVVQIYLRPDARASRLALDLLNVFGAWAKQQGALEMTMHLTGGADAPRVGKFLERCGYMSAGGNYFRSL